jgi:Fe-S cluster assembly protein SufD
MLEIKIPEHTEGILGGGLQSEEAFAAHMASLRDAPAWLHDLKRSAWDRFRELPYPGRRDEQWRYARPGDITLDRFALPTESFAENAEELIGASHYVESYSGTQIFADDQLIWESPLNEDLRSRGVVLLPLADAWNQQGNILQEYLFCRTPKLGAQKFEQLHAAMVSNGTLVYVPRGVEIADPIIIRHWACRDRAALFPHTLVIAEDHARVDVVDVFESQQADTENFVCGMASIFAGNGAHVFYNAVQSWSLQTRSLHLNSVTAERDANVKTVVLNVGSASCRNEQHTRMLGSGSEVTNLALSTPTDAQEYDLRTLQTHAAPHTRSNLLYKNALFGKSRSTFSGLIKVEEQAQQTDAYQTVRNLLLTPDAQANSLPGLEILANDVKCSHGATTGMLDEEQLYYLKARGIPERTAQQLLVYGFFEEIIGKIASEELRDNLRTLLRRKLRA